MKRGDTIYEINGKQMATEADYNKYYNELYLNVILLERFGIVYAHCFN